MISVSEIHLGWLTVLVACILVLLGILWLRPQRSVLLLLSLWVAVPIAGITFLDVVLGTKAIGVNRYWMVLTPALYLLLASGLEKLNSIRVKHHRLLFVATVSVVVLFLFVVSVWTARGSLRPKPDRYRELTRVIDNYTIAQRKTAVFTEGSNAIALALGYYSCHETKVFRAAYVMDKLKTQSIGEVFEGSDIWLVDSGESGAKVFLERNGYRLVNQPVMFGHILLYAYEAPGTVAPEDKTK